ncbi:MAG: hypothetical protein BAA01_05630 [Bacillus thermozeamaize]|uniref:Leucine-binding protein domain-containing protein n=1 Tax=Bacillus thermozeamaize TaxID=230954 RepID=A0A1Y3PBA3_9BACI|nr:MAG: hypothetical protein BAA01_05630 [Bacillus thermozeamaize]
MRRKRLTFVGGVITLVLLLIITACGGNQPANTSPGNNQQGGDAGNQPKQQAQGVTDSEILVGHIGPQTGPAAQYDLIRQGIQSYFNYVNENGGVNGRKLKLIAYDDQYQPSKTVPAAKRLVEEDKVFALVGNVCTPCNAAVKPYLVEKGIPVVAVSSGADQFVNPPVKNYFGYLMNYRMEAAIYVDYAVNKMGAKKVAIAYQNDDFGKEGLEGAKEAIKKYNGLEVVAEVPFLVTDADFSSQAQQLQKSKPDVILAFATPKPAASLRKEMHKINATNIPMIVCSVGANDTNLFKLAGEEIWEGVISSASMPMADDSDDPDMKLYKERFTKDFPNSTYNGNAQWGWVAAQIFVEGLKRAGDDLSWENYIKALETLDKWDGSLYPSVTYTPEYRYGLTSLFMTEAKDGKIVPITGIIHYDPATGKITYED